MVQEARTPQGGQEIKDKNPFRPLALAWELGYTIAIVLAGLALLGRLADKFLGTSPYILLLGIFSSIIITSFLVYRKMKNLIQNP